MQSATTQSDPTASGGATFAPSLPIVAAPEPNQEPDLFTYLLREQQTLTAVEHFSREHDNGLPAQSQYYAKLLPASPPGDGQQYAFEVDLDRCSGCKACVTACHSLNGLDEQETWRDVGLLIGGTSSNPVMQHVTTACHHCLEPGCMNACPVDAYEKDPVTGIVKHVDDQCFGCQYCTLACPYDVPKYHARKGIVRKCDMCSDRLAVGEAPACVQACPHEAISIRVVDVQQVIEDAEADHFLPAAPDPQITLPTTHYKTSRVFPRNTLPADYHTVSSQHPHWPLIVMLVLTQLSVGASIVGLVLEKSVERISIRSDSASSDSSTHEPQITLNERNEFHSTAFRQLHASIALGFGLLALAASTLHLGRPQYAFRAFIGLRHSWLSREIIAFGAFAGAACLYAGLCWISPESPLRPVLAWAVAVTGAVGVFCSVMIYVVTGRELWSLGRTTFRFGMTSLVLGIAATWLSILVLGVLFDVPAATRLSRQAGVPLVQALVVAATVKLIVEASLLRHLMSRRQSALKRSTRLMVGPLSGSTFARFACGLLGGIVMPLFLWKELTTDDSRDLFLTISVAMLFVACLVGELLERYQFFAACASPRMPGRLHS
jgi:Fe-S-cluster-containing dehydrogenase component/DMSO reductase anchor subunit